MGQAGAGLPGETQLDQHTSPRRATCVRPACRLHPPVFVASTVHLLVLRPSDSFPPTSVGSNWHRADRPPRKQRRELGADCSPVQGSSNCCLVGAGSYPVCCEKSVPSRVNSGSSGLHEATWVSLLEDFSETLRL